MGTVLSSLPLAAGTRGGSYANSNSPSPDSSGKREGGDQLRFITCGSVDDGKSTLIGRLLHDTGQLADDTLAKLTDDSARTGTQGDALDFALLVDGLSAEREQGITIDIAYRYFASTQRRYIVADCPGHVQYTRNMVTGASTADAAVILVDVRAGLLTQTRRHAWIAHRMGVATLILAVNKMDAAGYDRAAYEAVAADFAAYAAVLGAAPPVAIPLSGLTGGNVARRDAHMPWYDGPTLLDALDAAPAVIAADVAFRMPVQWVNRPDASFRGFSGTVAAASVAAGDTVRVLPSGVATTVAEVRGGGQAGDAVTIVLADNVDCARGDVLAAAGDPPQSADQFEATLVWMDQAPMLPGRRYWLKLATRTVAATVTRVRHAVDVDTQAEVAAKTLALNGIGVVQLSTDAPVVFEPYGKSRVLGGFILIDQATNATVACGMIHFALRRSQNVHWQATDVNAATRAALLGQRPSVVWFTGLSGAGKSTIANLVEKRLHAMGRHTYLLDGDNIRHGLCRDLGFTDADRVENIRRVGEVAKLMADAGLIVLTAFISPFRAERDMVRALLPAGQFVEVHVDTPLAEAEARDVKGLYAKARRGELSNFTGIDSPYEPPENPEIVVDTLTISAEAAAERIVGWLLGGQPGAPDWQI